MSTRSSRPLARVVLAAAWSLGSTGCGVFAPPKAVEAKVTYLGQQLKCADEGKNREEIDVCRRAVRAKWGVAETPSAGSR